MLNYLFLALIAAARANHDDGGVRDGIPFKDNWSQGNYTLIGPNCKEWKTNLMVQECFFLYGFAKTQHLLIVSGNFR